MPKNQTLSKPSCAEQLSGRELGATACCASLLKTERIRKAKERWREEVASRVISISGSLLQEGRGAVVHEFQKDLDALLAKHGVTRYPYLNVTVVRKNGRYTPIAAPDGYFRHN